MLYIKTFSIFSHGGKRSDIYVFFVPVRKQIVFFNLIAKRKNWKVKYIYYFCGKIAINFLKIIWNLQNLYIFVNIPLAMQIKALKINLNTSIFNEYSHFKEINFLKENIFCDAF